MRLMAWQLCPKWHLGWNWTKYEGFDIDELHIFIGPLQMRFWK